ncbi:MAG TPA: MFS transporter [Candidatus Binatia bacterium]|nr:MFS transporter [Candidatus Binatia bacterium]
MKLDRIPIAFGALLCAALAWFVSQALPAPAPGDRSAFAQALARAVLQERRIVFPLGVAASIATLLVLLRHGALTSRRGALQGAALLALFGSGLLSVLETEPTARALLALIASDASLAPLLSRLAVDRWLHLGLAVAAVACLMVADREPLPDESAGSFAGLDARHRTLLFLLGTATLFQGYDQFIVSMALPYIGRDLDASERGLGLALSLIRVGALVSVLLGYAADRRGRRGLLLVTILAYTVATAATGLSRTIVQFVIFQLVAEIFLVAELALTQVVIAEEFPARARSLGQGLLGTFGALGAGLAALLFPIFQETSAGWRGLYFVGLAPLLLVAYLRRSLPETARWKTAEHATSFGDVAAGPYRARFLVLLALAFGLGASVSPAFAFASYRATNHFGWNPSEVSAMVLMGGGLGMFGWFLSGLFAERAGRRRLGVLAFTGTTGAAWTYYSTGWLAPTFALLVFFEAGATVALNALGTELFPTRVRSTAKSWISNAAVIGAVFGMACVGALGNALGGADRVIRLLSMLPVLCCAGVLALPETQGLELEDIVAVEERTVTSISHPR